MTALEAVIEVERVYRADLAKRDGAPSLAMLRALRDARVITMAPPLAPKPARKRKARKVGRRGSR